MKLKKIPDPVRTRLLGAIAQGVHAQPIAHDCERTQGRLPVVHLSLQGGRIERKLPDQVTGLPEPA